MMHDSSKSKMSKADQLHLRDAERFTNLFMQSRSTPSANGSSNLLIPKSHLTNMAKSASKSPIEKRARGWDRYPGLVDISSVSLQVFDLVTTYLESHNFESQHDYRRKVEKSSGSRSPTGFGTKKSSETGEGEEGHLRKSKHDKGDVKIKRKKDAQEESENKSDKKQKIRVQSDHGEGFASPGNTPKTDSNMHLDDNFVESDSSTGNTIMSIKGGSINFKRSPSTAPAKSKGISLSNESRKTVGDASIHEITQYREVEALVFSVVMSESSCTLQATDNITFEDENKIIEIFL